MNSLSPWLSILIPAHNVQDYIGECLASITTQALDGVEILVLDDHSSDQTGAIVAEAQASSPVPLRLLAANGCGVGAARNTLLRAALGDYLWFIDADDKMLPGAMTELQAIVRQHQPDVVMCDFMVWRSSYRSVKQQRKEQHRPSFHGVAGELRHDAPSRLVEGLFRCSQLHPWSKIHKRALWQGLAFPEDRRFEDVALMPRLALAARSYYYCDTVWIAYRQRPGSILSRPTAQNSVELMQAFADFPRHLSDSGQTLSQAAWRAYLYCAAVHFKASIRDLAKLTDTTPTGQHYALCKNYFQQITRGRWFDVLRAYMAQRRTWRWISLQRWSRLAQRRSAP